MNGALTRAQRGHLLRNKTTDGPAARHVEAQLATQIAAQLNVPIEHAEQLLAAVA